MATLKGGGGTSRTLRELARRLGNPKTLRVGFLEGATYPAKSEGGKGGQSVAMVAAAQNFGTKRIPKRPFFSNMVEAKKASWGPALAKLVTEHGYDANQALNLMGEGIVGQLKESIVNTNDPPLADATVERKGFAKPLVDTGHMLNSAAYDVQDDGTAS